MRQETILRGTDIKGVTMNGQRLKDCTGVRFSIPASGFVEVNIRLMVSKFKCVDNAVEFETAIEKEDDGQTPQVPSAG